MVRTFNVYKSKFFLTLLLCFSSSALLGVLDDSMQMMRYGASIPKELAKIMAKSTINTHLEGLLATMDNNKRETQQFVEEYTEYKNGIGKNGKSFRQYQIEERERLDGIQRELNCKLAKFSNEKEQIEKKCAAVLGGQGQKSMPAKNAYEVDGYKTTAEAVADINKEIMDNAAIKAKITAKIEVLGKISESDILEYHDDDKARSIIKNQLAKLWRPTDSKALLAQGLAGESWEQLDVSTIETWSDAVQQGLIANGAKKLGDVLGRRMENALEQTVGRWFDMGFKKLMDACSGIGNLLFYGGKEPFTQQDIANWSELVKEILDDIEKMLKDGLKDSMRGSDFTVRPVPETQDGQSADSDLENKAEEEKDFIWTALMEGYAEQFGKMVEVFEARKKHYKNKSMVTFYVNQLTKRLNKLISILTASKTLKDFDAALHSCKPVLTAYKKNIASLLKRLSEEDEIKPQSYSLATKGGTSTKAARPSSRRDDDADAAFPNSYGYGGMGA